MSPAKLSTKAINLRIEVEHEQLLRETVSRIRNGGPGFRSALKLLIDDDTAAEYVPAHEIHGRFADLERRLREHAEAGADFVSTVEIEARFAHYLPATQVDSRLDVLENRIRALEKQR